MSLCLLTIYVYVNSIKLYLIGKHLIINYAIMRKKVTNKTRDKFAFYSSDQGKHLKDPGKMYELVVVYQS